MNPKIDQAAAARELDTVASAFEQVQSRVRETSPQYAALTRPAVLSLEEVQGSVLDRDTVLLVGQYRYVAQDFYWEMPTGGHHAGETLEQTAQRELAEEAGHEAGRLTKLCDFHTSKSILREVAHLYLAEDLRPASRPPDRTESIERRAFPFSEVLQMVERGEIKDSMTVIAVLHAARLRGG